MMRRFIHIRRKFALFVCPELAATPTDGLATKNKALVVSSSVELGENWPLVLGSIYAEHIDRSLFTVAKRIGVHSRFFLRLAENLGCSVDTFNQAMGWFDENWPTDLAWPVDVPRPSQAPKRKRRVA